ncbi:MAG: branched-chain amino acid transport system permease protein [Streptosporangiaceae bacterium]|jgi:branched-chain amino acid transport system permease protein|nr:branched-chain amino acid transport system permease protein [Streptosporangiaceae bacterium]
MTIPTGSNFISALLSGVLLGGLFAITALGLSLVFGVMRLVNIVHGELIVLGAYIALELTRHGGLDPLLTILIVAPVLFVVAAPAYRVLLEPLMAKGPEPALLTTFALSVIAQNLYILFWSGDTQTLQASYATASVSVAGLRVPAMYLISFAIALVLCGAVHLMLQRTGLGREIRASSEDSEAAAGLGVNVVRVRVFVYGLAAACAAVGGVLVGITFDFTPTVGITYLLTGFAVVVLGGLGSVKGTLLGAILLGVIESVGAAFVGDGYRNFIGFVAFLIVLSLRPQGLFGRVQVR